MNPNEMFQDAIAILERIDREGFGKYRPRDGKPILREKQREALKKILYAKYVANKKYVSLTAPTGSGKSVIAAVIGLIENELSGFKTNLTTSSRALQTQYGEDLRVDNSFKVIMGTGNYKCSFFRNDEGDRELVGQAPCQKWDSTLIPTWYARETIESDSEIRTLHTDQDEKCLEGVSVCEDMISSALATDEKPEKIIMQALKNTCKDCGSCSFYRARSEADRAPVAIRSIQHMLFYIMYGVTEGGDPILQQRPIHIHDECHSIESVFRDFFSVTFTEAYYADTAAKADERSDNDKMRSPLEVTSEFKKFQSPHQRDWSEQDKINLANHLQKQMGSIIEKTILPKENDLRALSQRKRINNAEEFLKSSLTGDIAVDLEALNKHQKNMMKWFKNLHHALADARIAVAAKQANRRYLRKFGIQVGKSKKGSGLEISVFPLSLEGMVDRYFGSQFTLFMSATPQPREIFEKMFGLTDQVAHIEIESEFPTKNSPIFWEPVETVTHDRAKALGMPLIEGQTFKNVVEKDLAAADAGWEIIFAKLSDKILEIVDAFPDYAGIIPCNSYKMVQGLQKHLGSNSQFMYAMSGEENRFKVTEFKERARSGESVIFVSAGITEGHSFEDDVSRLQILPKMPYPARDAVMETLCSRWTNHYYTAKTAMVLQQMVGRSMRSSKDFCLTILLDEKFNVILNEKLRKFYAQHFFRCLQFDKTTKSDWRTYEIDAAKISY